MKSLKVGIQDAPDLLPEVVIGGSHAPDLHRKVIQGGSRHHIAHLDHIIKAILEGLVHDLKATLGRDQPPHPVQDQHLRIRIKEDVSLTLPVIMAAPSHHLEDHLLLDLNHLYPSQLQKRH